MVEIECDNVWFRMKKKTWLKFLRRFEGNAIFNVWKYIQKITQKQNKIKVFRSFMKIFKKNKINYFYT